MNWQASATSKSCFSCEGRTGGNYNTQRSAIQQSPGTQHLRPSSSGRSTRGRAPIRSWHPCNKTRPPLPTGLWWTLHSRSFPFSPNCRHSGPKMQGLPMLLGPNVFDGMSSRVLGGMRTVPFCAPNRRDALRCWEDACSLRGKNHRACLVFGFVDRATALHFTGAGGFLCSLAPG